MIISKRYLILLAFFLVGAIMIIFFFNGSYTRGNQAINESIDPLVFNNATIYGTIRLSEKIDGNRSGMTTHDLHIIIDSLNSGRITKSYIKKTSDDYKQLTWADLKKNILDEADNYVGLRDISPKFKSEVLNSKVKITGRVYKHCMDTYYLIPIEEKEPEESFSCWAVTEQYHIRLSGYSNI